MIVSQGKKIMKCTISNRSRGKREGNNLIVSVPAFGSHGYDVDGDDPPHLHRGGPPNHVRSPTCPSLEHNPEGDLPGRLRTCMICYTSDRRTMRLQQP